MIDIVMKQELAVLDLIGVGAVTMKFLTERTEPKCMWPLPTKIRRRDFAVNCCPGKWWLLAGSEPRAEDREGSLGHFPAYFGLCHDAGIPVSTNWLLLPLLFLCDFPCLDPQKSIPEAPAGSMYEKVAVAVLFSPCATIWPFPAEELISNHRVRLPAMTKLYKDCSGPCRFHDPHLGPMLRSHPPSLLDRSTPIRTSPSVYGKALRLEKRNFHVANFTSSTPAVNSFHLDTFRKLSLPVLHDLLSTCYGTILNQQPGETLLVLPLSFPLQLSVPNFNLGA